MRQDTKVGIRRVVQGLEAFSRLDLMDVAELQSIEDDLSSEVFKAEGRLRSADLRFQKATRLLESFRKLRRDILQK